MPEANTIQWPSIEAFPKHVCGTIDRFLDISCTFAAGVIQATWRHHKIKATIDAKAMEIAISKFRSTTNFHPRYGAREIRAYFCEQPVYVTEKYDGTNVGKDEDGNMYGRRQMISGNSYQKTPLTSVETVDTHRMKEDLFSAIGGSDSLKDAFTMVVYGELMCNKNLYDYSLRALSCGWFPFGIILRHKTESTSGNFEAASASVRDLAAKLAAAGYACTTTTTDGEGGDAEKAVVVQVKVAMCPLRELVTVSGGGVTPASVADGMSLTTMVEHCEGWMVSCKGEGVVVSIPTDVLGRPTGTVRKFKTAAEPQGSNEQWLRRTLARLEALGGACVDVVVVSMLRTMLDVATATPPEGAGHKAPKPKKKKVNAAETKGAYPAQLVQEALDSALTKFDALDTFFAKGSHRMGEIRALLIKEIGSDMGAKTPAEQKQIKGTVAAFVGKSYGKWKKAQ